MAPRAKEGVQGFTVELDDQTYRRLKLQAVDERRPMAAIIRDSVRTYLDLFASNGKRK